MKKSQFEEITAALSIIITLICYKLEIHWLFNIYVVKSFLDTYCALKYAYISAMKDIKKEKEQKQKKDETIQ